jgi:hypothetical protein
MSAYIAAVLGFVLGVLVSSATVIFVLYSTFADGGPFVSPDKLPRGKRIKKFLGRLPSAAIIALDKHRMHGGSDGDATRHSEGGGAEPNWLKKKSRKAYHRK